MRAILGLVLLLLSSAAFAQTNYPETTVRILVGFPPGTAPDVVARAMSDKLGASLGKPVVIENITGANGNIACDRAAKSPPDGYTLVMCGNGSLIFGPSLYSKLPYDPVKDFVPVAGIATVPLILVTNPGFQAGSLKELVALAKAQPGKVDYASGGIGVTNHLVMEMFRSAAGVQLNHVPYKGGPPAVTDLIGGQINVMFETSVAVLPFVRQGKLRALAVSSARRIAAAPELPTVAELGYPGFSGVPWVAIMAPAHTPAAVVAKLNGEINKALQSKETRDYFTSQGVEPMVMTPDELGGFVKSEIAKWTRAVKDSGAKAD